MKKAIVILSVIIYSLILSNTATAFEFDKLIFNVGTGYSIYSYDYTKNAYNIYPFEYTSYHSPLSSNITRGFSIFIESEYEVKNGMFLGLGLSYLFGNNKESHTYSDYWDDYGSSSKYLKVKTSYNFWFPYVKGSHALTSDKSIFMELSAGYGFGKLKFDSKEYASLSNQSNNISYTAQGFGVVAGFSTRGKLFSFLPAKIFFGYRYLVSDDFSFTGDKTSSLYLSNTTIRDLENECFDFSGFLLNIGVSINP